MTRPSRPGLPDTSAGEDDPDSVPKPRRADARRNRERILTAADAIFTAQGVSTSTEEVARVAGVGIGTVFRHFPTKEALLREVMSRRLRRVADEARELAVADDPGEAFFTLIVHGAEQSAAKNAVAMVLADAGIDFTQAAAPVMTEIAQSLGTLLIRAQATGAVRRDIEVGDVIALLIGIARAAESTGWDPARLARTVTVICDGLRPR